MAKLVSLDEVNMFTLEELQQFYRERNKMFLCKNGQIVGVDDED